MDDGALIANARKAIYDAARQDLFLFFRLIFPYLEPQTSFVDAKHFRVLATAFEKVISGETPRLLVAVPPRFGKSMLGSAALPAWVLGLQPGAKVICASYGEDLARSFALKTRDVMLSPTYRSMFTSGGLEQPVSGLGELRTVAKGYRMATSVGGLVTGKGANLIIVDDPLKAIEAQSAQARQTAYEWLKGSLMPRFEPGDVGKMIVIMQRLHQDDLYGRLRDDGGWEVLEMPAQAYQPATYDLGYGEHWSLEAGDLLYPKGFDAAALAERRSSMSAAAFNAQFLQRPDAGQGTLFKRKYFQRYEKPPYPHHIEKIVQSWDPALSEEDDAAFSVCTTWAICDHKLYLLDVFRRRLEFPRLAYAVKSLQQKHRAELVIVEGSGIGKALLQDLNRDPEIRDRIISNFPKLGKVERATAQVPKIERRRVFLPTEAPWLEVFESEVMGFPLTKYQDQVDSMVQFLYGLDFFNRITNGLKGIVNPTAPSGKLCRLGEGLWPDPASPKARSTASTPRLRSSSWWS